MGFGIFMHLVAWRLMDLMLQFHSLRTAEKQRIGEARWQSRTG